MPTVDTTAEYLSPEADGAVGVPGLRVDTDETGDSGNREESKYRRLWILVPFKYLYSTVWHDTGLNILGSSEKVFWVNHLFTDPWATFKLCLFEVLTDKEMEQKQTLLGRGDDP